jgi:protease-4
MGTMTKRSDYCATGTAEISAAIQQAFQDPNVSAIVLHMDSGGGDVDGTEALGNIIAQQVKPIVSFVDGLSASANYWAASQTNHVMVSSKTTSFVGSIGVLAMHVDQSAFLEKQGVKVSIIRSSKATDKARMNSVEPLTDELLADYTAQLDSIHNTFISTVKSGRNKALGRDAKLSDSLFTGRVYNGQEAIKNGLADSVGTLSDAIRKADALARKGSKSSGSSASADNQSTTPMMKNLKALIMGKPAAGESTDASQVQPAAEQEQTIVAEEQAETEESELTDEQLATADEQIGVLRVRVSDQEKQIVQLNATIADRDQALATSNESLAAATTSVTELTTANETLTAENTQLLAWKDGNKAFLAKQEDESNRTEGAKPKSSWDVQADKVQEKAHKRK